MNVVVSHQNDINSTLQEFNTTFTVLGFGASPQQARDAVDQFVSSAQAAGKTVDEDDASLLAASARLSAQPWFTAFSRGNLDRELTRIGHARTALAVARTLMTDYALAGQFRHAYLDAVIDLDAVATASASGDLGGAKTILNTMKTHVDKALQLSTAPSLPKDVHDLMVDFQKFVSDFAGRITAAEANDANAVAAFDKNLDDDANKLGTYSSAKINADFTAFYKPLIDTYNVEMTAATA